MVKILGDIKAISDISPWANLSRGVYFNPGMKSQISQLWAVEGVGVGMKKGVTIS